MKNNEWNSEVHTPIVYKGFMFAVGKKKRGLFTCLSFDGKRCGTSAGKAAFGLGGYMMADGMFFVMEGDTGKLHMVDASAPVTTNSAVRRCSAARRSGDRWRFPAANGAARHDENGLSSI